MCPIEREIRILLIDDDPQTLEQQAELFPRYISEICPGCRSKIKAESNFDEAIFLLRQNHFDLVISDIYLGSGKTLERGKPRGIEVYRTIQQCSFCSVILCTNGEFPVELQDERPGNLFLNLVDTSKSTEIKKALELNLSNKVPFAVSAINSNIDEIRNHASQIATKYVWDFFVQKLRDGAVDLSTQSFEEFFPLLLRKRINNQLMLNAAECSKTPTLNQIAAECYIYPPLNRESLKLGSLMKHADGGYAFVLTPHCHLERRKPPSGSELLPPKASNVLLVKALQETDLPGEIDRTVMKKRFLPQALKAHFTPEGRYFYIPGIFDIPSLFCDYLQVSNIQFSTELLDHQIAVLDSPFAEALQANFLRINSSVGLPDF